MQVEVYLGDLGYKEIKTDIGCIREISLSEFLDLYHHVLDKEHRKELIKNLYHGDDYYETIKNMLENLYPDEAKKIVKSLNDDFLSIDEWHEKLKAINE